MKILHVEVQEFASWTEVWAAYNGELKALCENGIRITKSKLEAEELLKYFHKWYGDKGSRVFWIKKATHENVTTLILTEALID